MASVGVRSSSLLELYPVSLASYEPFLRRFYMEREQEAELYYRNPAQRVSNAIFSLELTLYSTTTKFDQSEDFESYRLIFGEEIPKDIYRLSDELLAHANAGGEIVHGGYNLIRTQIWPLLKTMWLLSRWHLLDFESLRENHKEDFHVGLIEISAFYNLELEPSRANSPSKAHP